MLASLESSRMLYRSHSYAMMAIIDTHILQFQMSHATPAGSGTFSNAPVADVPR